MPEMVECRTPNADGTVRVPAWKVDVVRKAVLHAVEAAGPEGLAFARLAAEVRRRLSEDVLGRLGSLGWHVTTVKLAMEVRGEIARLPGRGAQWLVMGER